MSYLDNEEPWFYRAGKRGIYAGFAYVGFISTLYALGFPVPLDHTFHEGVIDLILLSSLAAHYTYRKIFGERADKEKQQFSR